MYNKGIFMQTAYSNDCSVEKKQITLSRFQRNVTTFAFLR